MTGAPKTNPLILMKLSGPENLGAVNALLLALAFPLAWCTRDLVPRRKLNLFAALGLVSILLTGGIGLLQPGTQWLVVKEAAIPGLIGLAVAISAYTRYLLARAPLFTPALMDVERIGHGLDERGNRAAFEVRLRTTWVQGGSFFFSAAMHYFPATCIVVGPTDTSAFNEELGRLILLSYPMMAMRIFSVLQARDAGRGGAHGGRHIGLAGRQVW